MTSQSDYKLICHFIWLRYSRMKYESLIVVTNRQRIGQELKLNGNVGKSEYNDEWNTAIELRLESHNRKNRENVCLQPDFSYFAGWEHPPWNNCLQDEDHEKTSQLFNRKYGHVRSPFSHFFVSFRDTAKTLYRLLADRWSSWPGLM